MYNIKKELSDEELYDAYIRMVSGDLLGYFKHKRKEEVKIYYNNQDKMLKTYDPKNHDGHYLYQNELPFEYDSGHIPRDFKIWMYRKLNNGYIETFQKDYNCFFDGAIYTDYNPTFEFGTYEKPGVYGGPVEFSHKLFFRDCLTLTDYKKIIGNGMKMFIKRRENNDR